eukprot:403291-Pelagomonas_calceolata.AAC.2
MSSRDFTESSSSSLAPSIAVRDFKVAANNPRRWPGQTAGTEVAYRGLAGRPLLHLSAGQIPTSIRGPRNNPSLIGILPGFPHTRCRNLGLSRVPLKNGIY